MSKYNKTFFVYLILALGFIFGVIDYYNLNNISFLSQFSILKSTNDFLIFLTLLALLFYAHETFLLRKETQSQTDLSIMPMPAIYIKDNKFRMRNIGYAPMLNIEIEEWNLHIKDSEDKHTIKLSVPDPNVLIKDEVRTLDVKNYFNDEERSFDLSPHFIPEFANFSIPLEIKYEDIKSAKYKTKISLGLGRLAIIEPPARTK